MFKESIIKECLTILKRDEVKYELKNLLLPLIEFILSKIYPYIYLSLTFIFVSFLLHLGILILLLRNNTK
jgi:hypothetical protein